MLKCHSSETRSAAVRRHRIHQIFLRDGFTNCSRIAAELEIAVRTVLRDIDTMRALDFPIEYDAARKAYFYAEPVFNLPSVQVSESSLRAIQTAANSLEHQQCATITKQLRRIYEVLSSGVRANCESGESVVSFAGPTCPFPAETLDRLERAINTKKEIEFGYRKPGHATRNYRVRPHFLSSRDGIIYLVAADIPTTVVKSFVVARIVGRVSITRRGFKPGSLSVEAHFKNAFRVFAGARTRRITIRASPLAAPYLCERVWHASQRFSHASGGSVIVSLDVADLRDVRSWVLRWGPEVEVLEPPEFRAEVANALRAAVELYCRQPTADLPGVPTENDL